MTFVLLNKCSEKKDIRFVNKMAKDIKGHMLNFPVSNTNNNNNKKTVKVVLICIYQA